MGSMGFLMGQSQTTYPKQSLDFSIFIANKSAFDHQLGCWQVLKEIIMNCSCLGNWWRTLEDQTVTKLLKPIFAAPKAKKILPL